MANQIQVKRTSTAGRTPNTTSSGNTQYINAGEFALNMTDQILYTSDGTNLITVGANVVNKRITGTLTVNNVSVSSNITLNNNVDLNFKTVSGANVSFIQQNDDNFVFYSTNTTGGQRAVWAVYANSVTSYFNIVAPLQISSALNVGSSNGTAGQVLTSNGNSPPYWSTVSGGSGSINTAAQYTFSNLITHTANVYANTVTIVANVTATSVATGATANGTTQATAYPIVTTSVQFTTVAASTGAILPTAVPGQRIFIANDGANTLLLYPATGGIIDQTSLNTPISIASGGMWEGQALTSINWTSISPDTQGTNGVVVSQSNGAVILSVNTAYINTISSNSATYANSSVSNTFTVGTAAYYLANGSVSFGIADPSYSGNVGSAFTINSRGSTGLAIGFSNTQLSFAINPLSGGAWTMYDRSANGGVGTWTAGITQSNGFVGIGTTTPAATLDVVGTVNTSKANTLNQTLTDGATISWDTSIGQIATVTLAGSRTMAAPTNLKVSTYILHVIQDVTGSRTLTWNAVFKWPAGVAPVLSTGANKRDVFTFVSDGTNLYGSYLPDVR